MLNLEYTITVLEAFRVPIFPCNHPNLKSYWLTRYPSLSTSIPSFTLGIGETSVQQLPSSQKKPTSFTRRNQNSRQAWPNLGQLKPCWNFRTSWLRYSSVFFQQLPTQTYRSEFSFASLLFFFLPYYFVRSYNSFAAFLRLPGSSPQSLAHCLQIHFMNSAIDWWHVIRVQSKYPSFDVVPRRNLDQLQPRFHGFHPWHVSRQTSISTFIISDLHNIGNNSMHIRIALKRFECEHMWRKIWYVSKWRLKVQTNLVSSTKSSKFPQIRNSNLFI